MHRMRFSHCYMALMNTTTLRYMCPKISCNCRVHTVRTQHHIGKACKLTMTYKSKLHKNTKTAHLWLNIGDIMDLDIVRCFTWHPEVIIFYAKCKSNISLSEGLPTNYDECSALAELHPELSHVGV